MAGCRLAKASLALDLELPSLPPAWLAALGEVDGEVSFRDPAGSDVTIRLSPWSEGAAGLEVELTPGAYTAVLVTPVAVASQVRMRPAGAVFPLDVELDSSRLLVSWERGCAAWVLAKLLERTDLGGLVPGDLDFERVAGIIEDKGEGDPWRVDTSALLHSLTCSPDDTPVCRLLPSIQVRIPGADLPRGGGVPPAPTYVIDDPLFGPIDYGDDEGELIVEALPSGFHRLFASDPRTGPAGGWLDLLVTEREAAWIRREARIIPSSPAP